MTFDRATLDDWILVRSDGTPTYNFCVVVDDVTMKITHVIRGNDHLSNTPKQILCYEALGYPLPVFAHIPMILGRPEAPLEAPRRDVRAGVPRRGLSARGDGELLRAARLGPRRPGDLHREELVELFDLRHVGATPAIFDRTKLEWLNQTWMKLLAESPWAASASLERSSRISSVRDRRSAEGANHLCRGEPRDAGDHARRHGSEGALLLRGSGRVRSDRVRQARDAGARAASRPPSRAPCRARAWTETELEGACRQLAGELSVKLVDLAQPIRLALTGETASPPIFGIMADLGRETTLRRLRVFRDRVPRE